MSAEGECLWQRHIQGEEMAFVGWLNAEVKLRCLITTEAIYCVYTPVPRTSFLLYNKTKEYSTNHNEERMGFLFVLPPQLHYTTRLMEVLKFWAAVPSDYSTIHVPLGVELKPISRGSLNGKQELCLCKAYHPWCQYVFSEKATLTPPSPTEMSGGNSFSSCIMCCNCSSLIEEDTKS